jgi:hypothetical protein
MSKKRLVSSSYRSSSSPIKKAKVSRLTDTDEVVEEHKTDDTTKAVGENCVIFISSSKAEGTFVTYRWL